LRTRHWLLLLTTIPVLASAQGKVTLDFGSAGDRDVWIADKLFKPVATMKAAEATLDLPVAGGKQDRIFVWDRKTGNLASKSIGGLGPVWKLQPSDYSVAGRVVVRVVHEGAPVAVAFVTLKDAGGERESQIDPSKKGEAEFYGIKPGALDITVRYNVKGADAEPVKQSVVLNPKRSQPDQVYEVSLTEDVQTVEAGMEGANPGSGKTSGTSMKAGAENDNSKGGSVIGNVLIYVLGLGIAGAGIYFGLRYMKDNQEKVAEQLKKVGVQIPDPQDPAQQDPGPAPVPIPPAPPQKIILDDADPNVPVAGVAPVIPSAAISQPSLVMENGDVFPIPEGETVVGREATCGLALVAESTVSRRHAVLSRQGSSLTVRDEGSSNGTYLNGVKIAADTVLRPGDQVQFGQARFRFEA